jgi:hypothetical protein
MSNAGEKLGGQWRKLKKETRLKRQTRGNESNRMNQTIANPAFIHSDAAEEEHHNARHNIAACGTHQRSNQPQTTMGSSGKQQATIQQQGAPLMKHSLTDWERASVVRLKRACEEQNIAYKSVFELAKYVLVTRSVCKDNDKHADQKRLQAALQRIRKLRTLEKTMGLDSIDPLSAVDEIHQHSPGFYNTNYKQDKEGHWIVAHCYEYPPSDFVLASYANCAKFLKVDLHRMELAAADMEEARRGMAVVTLADGNMTLPKAIKYGRMVLHVKEFMSELHSSRIRKIYSQVPSIISHLINPAKKVLPKKIVERIKVVPRIADLDKYLVKESQEVSLRDWIVQRAAVYNETVEKLKL